MAEFVNLDSDDELLNQGTIIPYNPIAIQVIEPDAIVIDGHITTQEIIFPKDEGIYVINIEFPKGEEIVVEQICISPQCDVSTNYGEADEGGSFKKINLFSELTDDYQRAVARRNLGIAEKFAMIWGNIGGNVLHQTDLYDLIITSVQEPIIDLIAEINLKLAQWAYQIRVSLESKADLFSPEFQGTPTVPLPEISDNSAQIASTEWVNAKLLGRSNSNINFTLSKTYMFYGDIAFDLVCTWEYNSSIQSQSINGVSLLPDTRTYTFQGVNNPFIITMQYVIAGEPYTTNISFQKFYPIYYGTELDYLKLTKTKDYSLLLKTENQYYGYIYVPNDVNARFSVDGLIGGFINIGTLTIFDTSYYIYKTVNFGLGDLYLNIL